jgi:hypothetical protein
LWSSSDLQEQPLQHISENIFKAKPSFAGLSFHMEDSKLSKIAIK